MILVGLTPILAVSPIYCGGNWCFGIKFVVDR